MMWFWISAVLMVVTAIIHSLAGEKRLIEPILAMDQGIMANGHSRRLLRSAWHLTSLYMISNAIVIAWPGVDTAVKAVIGGIWLVVGLFSLIASRGKHIGWPSLIGAGVTALVGSWV